MNITLSTIFTEWFHELLGVLDRHSLNIVDNASYHDVQTVNTKLPTLSNKKAYIIQWLTDHKLPHEAWLNNLILYELVKKYKTRPIYQTDVIAGEMGHTVLQTPPT